MEQEQMNERTKRRLRKMENDWNDGKQSIVIDTRLLPKTLFIENWTDKSEQWQSQKSYRVDGDEKNCRKITLKFRSPKKNAMENTLYCELI